MKGGDLIMDINKQVNFSIDIIKGRDKNTKEEKEYKAICITVLGIKKVIAWLTDSQYLELKSKLS